MGVARSITVTAVAMLVSCIRVQAECIIVPPPCEAMTRNTVVVLARVLQATSPWDNPRRPGERFLRHDVRLHVIERFKGISGDQGEITASIPWGAETIGLAQGSIYLVYADVSPSGNWQTACTRTRRTTAEDDEVRVLRQCRKDTAR
jgi:hypothetical protein